MSVIRIPGEGPVPASVMLIGERPGKDEAKWGRPFCGAAGKELDRYLWRDGRIDRADCYVTNLVKGWKYGDPDPEPWEIERDWPVLQDEIRRVNPTVIGLVGRFATRHFLGDVDMEVVHGIPRPLSMVQIAVPLYHPAAAFYNVQAGALVQEDFRALGMVLRGEMGTPFDAVITHYGDSADRCMIDVGGPMAIDTEGSQRYPWCLTWSKIPGHAAISFPGQKFAPSGLILLHNSLHDLGVLRAMGSPVDEDKFIDTMVLAYLLCTEPQGLKALAYRHAGMEMLSYDELTRDANRQRALEYVMAAVERGWPEAEEYFTYEVKGGDKTLKFHKPQSLNYRLNRLVADWGKDPTVDIRSRWSKWEDDYRAPVEQAIGEMPEATLDDVDRDKAIQYACRDADATLRIYPILWKKIEALGLEGVVRMDHAIIPMADRMQAQGMLIDVPYLERLGDECTEAMEREQEAIKEITGSWINPNSGDQVAALLFGQLGLQTDKLTKTKKRQSTNDKVLEGLWGEHPVIDHILDYREASKARDSFCRALPRFAGSDGRVRCNLRITRVASGRLAANSPNLLGIPVRTEVGKRIRGGFIAAPGKILVSVDLDQVEMRQMAHESEDPFMCELFIEGKRDVHRETASLMFGIPPSEVHPMHHRYPAKRVGFGVITGITGMGLVDQMALARAKKPDGSKWTEEECDELIVRWFGVYPSARTFMERCRVQTRRDGMIRDMWGRIRPLPGIYSPLRHVREEAERQSHSHVIQAGAQGIIKTAMALIWQKLKEWRFEGVDIECILQVHDELIFEMDDWAYDICVPEIIGLMTGSVELQVPLKAKAAKGLNWGALEK